MEPLNPRIVIYAGIGAYQDSVNDLMTNIEEEVIGPEIVCVENFNSFDWKKNISLLVVPPGDGQKMLQGLNPAAHAIQHYVKENPFLAIGSGVIPFTKSYYFHDFQEGHLVNDSHLRFIKIFNGTVVSPGIWQHENPHSVFNEDALSLNWCLKGQQKPFELKMFHFSDPCFFDACAPNVEIVATFSQTVPSYGIKNFDGSPDYEFDPDKHAAAIEYTNPKTKAKAILCAGCRPEMIPEADTSEYLHKLDMNYHKRVLKDLTANQKARKHCIRDIFERLDLPVKSLEI